MQTPNPKRSLTESILAFVAGDDQAAAIYGDLLELAPNRSRLWFAAAYIRTLVSAGWRGPVAFVFGLIVLQFPTTAIEFWIARVAEARQFQPHYLYVVLRMDPLIAAITGTLWFVVPFAAVRYGARDPMVRLACTLLLLDTCLFVPWLSLVSAPLAVVVLLVALSVKGWRRPATILISCIAIGATLVMILFPVVALGLAYIQEQLPHPHLRYKEAVPWNAIMSISMLGVAAACSRLRHWLIPTAPVPGGD